MGRSLVLLLAIAMAHAQSASDPMDILSRARTEIAAAMQRVPRYACTQTIDRSYFTRTVSNRISAPSCDDAAKPGTSLKLGATDRVRLEVAEAESAEMHAWPGASRFETRNIDELVSRGPIATGGFGGYLIDLFANEGAQFEFEGRPEDSGRAVLRYRYQVAREMSHYKIRAGDGWVITPYSGTFDIDGASLELLRMTIDTPDLPAATQLCSAHSSLEYARFRIGDGDFLLPSVSKLHLVNRSTVETRSSSVFSGCREYRAESVLHIEGGEESEGAVSSTTIRTAAALPPGARLTVRLGAAIDSDIAAAGDAVSATVTNAVLDPATKAVLYAAGAIARGRISRLEHWTGQTPRFIIGIRWESISSGLQASPFTAILDRSGDSGVLPPDALGMGAAGRRQPGGGLGRRPPPLGPPDSFVFATDSKRHVIPARYEMRWVTVTANAGEGEK